MEYSLKFVSTDREYLVNSLEAVLFASGDPISLERIAVLFDITKMEASIVADSLMERLDCQNSSFQLVKLADSVQLCTKKEYAEPVQKFLEIIWISIIAT